jgi:fluoride exporter
MGFLAFGFWLTAPERPTFIPSPHLAARILGSAISWSLFILIYVAFGIVQPHQRVAVLGPMAFSVFGTWTRHLLGVRLNLHFTHFPLGTFVSNMLGTAILGGMYVVRCTYPGLDYTRMAVVQGIMDGFCGCLSTVSTYAAETRAMKGWHVWVYVFASWIGAQALLVCIVGSVSWSGRIPAIRQCSA